VFNIACAIFVMAFLAIPLNEPARKADLIQAAKKEGEVVVSEPLRRRRRSLHKDSEAKYGIKANYFRGRRPSSSIDSQ